MFAVLIYLETVYNISCFLLWQNFILIRGALIAFVLAAALGQLVVTLTIQPGWCRSR